MKVKICGIIHPEDAYFAANAGADYIGVVFSKSSKRYVSLLQAKEIYAAIQSSNTKLVGVFENASAEEILTISNAVGIDTIQLHGSEAHRQLELFRSSFYIFFAVTTGKVASIDLSEQVMPLYDYHQPGSGKSFDWQRFTPPTRPWILAGGLNQDNIAHAIQLLKPTIVDVATGVEYETNIRKNPTKIINFMSIVKQE
jgi:phosphoribosylanthranilate isomerase